MAWILNNASAILSRFGEQRRRVVAGWRILIEARRIAQAGAAPLPGELESLKILKLLLRKGDLVRVGGAGDVYRIDVPFASLLPASEEQVIQEANPSAVFSYLTALAHHALTDQIPGEIFVTRYDPPDPGRIPLGTAPEEWVGLPPPPLWRPKQLGAVSVHWTHTKGVWDFGHVASFGSGLPIYVTDVERTLIDAIRAPEKSGGIANVLRAWKRARELVDGKKLAGYVERIGEGILRQRAGFLLESLGLSAPQLNEWKERRGRGGSVRLLAAAPYAPEFSPEWNLSLNVPAGVLAELKDE